jgi:hypothetical protein
MTSAPAQEPDQKTTLAVCLVLSVFSAGAEPLASGHRV